MLIFGAIWTFREQIGFLIKNINKARIIKGEFSAEILINNIKNEVPSIVVKESPQDVRKLAEDSPMEAIDMAWQDLADTASSATSLQTTASPIAVADALIEKKIFDQKEAEAFYKMYDIRKDVTDPSSIYVTNVASANAYTDFAYGLEDKIIESPNIQSDDVTATASSKATPKDEIDEY